MQHWLFITIDTEEDDWGAYEEKNPSVENIKRIPQLQEIFEKYSAIPTYLINFPVATDDYSIKLLKDLYQNGKGDIGTHCHPWNTPPYNGTPSIYEVFLKDLSEDLLYRKLNILHGTICRNLQMTPTVFRAGKWNFSKKVAKALIDLRYQIDTSILPFNHWQYAEPSFQLFSNKTFGFCKDDSLCKLTDGCSHCEKSEHCILEIPPTTGFLQNGFSNINRIRDFFISNNFTKLPILRVLNKLRIINYRKLSPEKSSSEDMIKLTKAITQKGYSFLNMHFHSTNLLPGKSPFVKDNKDLKAFLNRIDKYLRFAFTEKISFKGMSGAWKLIENRNTN
jgi:hypothetical protein